MFVMSADAVMSYAHARITRAPPSWRPRPRASPPQTMPPSCCPRSEQLAHLSFGLPAARLDPQMWVGPETQTYMVLGEGFKHWMLGDSNIHGVGRGVQTLDVERAAQTLGWSSNSDIGC